MITTSTTGAVSSRFTAAARFADPQVCASQSQTFTGLDDAFTGSYFRINRLRLQTRFGCSRNNVTVSMASMPSAGGHRGADLPVERGEILATRGRTGGIEETVP